MNDRYTPELGQMAFGQPFKEYACPAYLEAALEMIRNEVGRVEWNRQQKEFDPFGNTGAKYKTDLYEVEAYCWDDEIEQPWNFKWRDLEVSWYKYLHRGMSMNRETTPDECSVMLDECLAATKANDPPLY